VTENRRLFPPYVLPYLVYVGLAAVAAEFVGREVDYAIRILLTGVLVAWAWRSYAPLRGPHSPAASVVWGLLAGLVGLQLWLWLTRPFLPEGADPWSDAAFALRLVAAALLVPIFEEQLMRGYVLRFVHQWRQARRRKAEDPLGETLDRRSILEVAPGAAGVAAVVVSSLVFAVGHAPFEMVAAFVYGVLMAGLWILRKDLLCCVVAHATTNVGLAVFVRLSGEWGLW
jgi:membrane protease YdiL (CAAX protease family)